MNSNSDSCQEQSQKCTADNTVSSSLDCWCNLFAYGTVNTLEMLKAEWQCFTLPEFHNSAESTVHFNGLIKSCKSSKGEDEQPHQVLRRALHLWKEK